MTACCGTSSAPCRVWVARPHPAVLPGTQAIAGIREQPRQPDGAGPDVDLAVREIELALVRIGDAIGENQFEFQQPGGGLPLLRGREPPRIFQILLLAGGEVDLDRIDCRDSGDDAAGRAYQRAHLQLGDARDAVDRRRQPGESKIDLRGLDRGLGGLERRRQRP